MTGEEEEFRSRRIGVFGFVDSAVDGPGPAADLGRRRQHLRMADDLVVELGADGDGRLGRDGAAVQRRQVGRGVGRPPVADQVDDDQLLFG